MKKELQDTLNSLGNTPIDEPKLYKLLDTKPLKKTKIVKSLGVDIKAHTAMEIAEFFRSVTIKVMNLKDENEVFKSTTNTENLELPDFEESEQIQEAWLEMAESKDSKKTYKKVEALALKISKLDAKKLTEWEKRLVIEQILHTGIDVTKTALGNV